MRRAAAIALAALAAAPGGAAAQFRASPLVIPAPGLRSTVLAEPFVTPPAATPPADLLLARSGSAPSLRLHHALLGSLPSPVAQPASFACAAAGRLAQNGGDALPDVAWCAGIDQIQIAFGDAPGVLRSYTHVLNSSQAPTLTFVRLHPAPRDTDVLVLPWNTGGTGPGGEIYALDFGPGADGPLLPDREWEAGGITKRGVLPDEILTLRLGPTARALGIDDLYLPGFGSVTIFAHEAAPAGSTLADVRFGPKVRVGGTDLEPGVDPTTWLPPGVMNNDVLGAGPLDVDFDGDLDLVVSLSPAYRFNETFPRGRLLWVERTGDVAALATQIPWGDLTAHPDLQPLVDPSVLTSFDLGGEPALAVFDRGSDAVLVVTSDAAAGRLRVWRGSAAGRHLRSLRLADLVGSTAPDLVADGTAPLEDASPPASPAVLVWPDLGDASPALAWAAGSPGAPVRGEDHPLAVSARDADDEVTVDWLVGDPYGTPASRQGPLAPGVDHEVGWVIDGALLCDPPPQALAVTVRATDARGVFEEIAASLEVTFAPPALALAGAVPADRLVLPPGGTAATLEGSAWTGCGDPVTFTWGGTIFDAAAGFVEEGGPTTTRRIVDLPESSYPALLAGDPDATLLAADPGGLTSPPAVLALDLDAGALVEVEHAADVAALAPGQVALLRTTIRSRLGVALPAVRVVDALAGLVPAGPPRVSGAQLASSAADGTDLVLDALPPSGAEVVVELSVRSTGGRGASAVEVRSSGGHLLTPAAAASPGDVTTPGCGCSGPRAGPEALLALAALALVARRRRPGRAR
jgi:MYXO-CTERM domain-containing protein